MTSTLISHEGQVELDFRESDGIEVALLWNRGAGSLTLAVRDARSAESFELAVEPAEAADAFRHPFAYAAFRGLDDYANGQRVERAVSELERVRSL